MYACLMYCKDACKCARFVNIVLATYTYKINGSNHCVDMKVKY